MTNLLFITHRTERYSYFESACMALEGGCKWIQLRMKDAPLEETEAVARRLKPLCKAQSAVLMIDDHVELAKKLRLDGVHLGRHDMPVEQARKVLGAGYIIGGTANTFEDIVRCYRAGADYLGVGPFRFTTTKQNLSPVLGTESYASLLSQMKEAGIDLPVLAIGGITFDDIPGILQTGVTGIALSGAILQAENPVEETRRIIGCGLTSGQGSRTKTKSVKQGNNT